MNWVAQNRSKDKKKAQQQCKHILENFSVKNIGVGF